MNFLLPRLAKLILLSILIASCSYFQPKSQKAHTTWPQGSPWSIKKILVSQGQLDSNEMESLKDALVFQNGVTIKDIAFQLEYIDAFTKTDDQQSQRADQGIGEITYLFKGSPCQDCDNIRSIFILNPTLGKAKMSFVPGSYFSAAPELNNSSEQKEFEGEVYYGKCLKNSPAGVFIHKIEYRSTVETVERLLHVRTFQDNYRTVDLALAKLNEIKNSKRDRKAKCFEMKKKKRIVIPM